MSGLQASLLAGEGSSVVIGSDAMWRDQVNEQVEATKPTPAAAGASSSLAKQHAAPDGEVDAASSSAVASMRSSKFAKGTMMGSVFNFCNCMFGVGVLTLPNAFNRVGVLLGLGLVLSCGLLVTAVYMLVNASIEMCPAATTYSGLLTDSLGQRWSRAYDAWICVTVFGTTVAWSSTIANLLENMLLDAGWIAVEPMMSGLNNRQLLVLGTTVGILWPLVSIPTFHKLRQVAGLALFAILFTGFGISLRALQASQPTAKRTATPQPCAFALCTARSQRWERSHCSVHELCRVGSTRVGSVTLWRAERGCVRWLCRLSGCSVPGYRTVVAGWLAG